MRQQAYKVGKEGSFAVPGAFDAYHAKCERFRKQFLLAKNAGRNVKLEKTTSNLFRSRLSSLDDRIKASDFNQILSLDTAAGTVDVEGMTSYERLVGATLPHGFMPAVVPELKTITIGGALSGGGLESSSFRYGFVHETIQEVDVLTGAGELVTCRPGNDHQELFYGLANSYGTFGYILRVRANLVRVGPYVRLRHTRYTDHEAFYRDLAESCEKGAAEGSGLDFVDATVFGTNDMVLSTGAFVREVPKVSSYTAKGIYYKSLNRLEEDALTVADYIWRWDPDWFWCSRAFGAQSPVLRPLFTATGLLRSTTYWKIRAFLGRHPLIQYIATRGKRFEWVIQDVEIPLENALKFHQFLLEKVPLRPFWICPVKSPGRSDCHPLYQTDPAVLYINFGFWGGVPELPGRKDHHNRLVEDKVMELGGKKSLYSSVHYEEDVFWSLYNKPAYDRIKKRYDPDGALRNLYQKCVQRR